MEQERDAAERAQQLSASVYPRHTAMIEVIRLERGGRTGKIPKLSVVVQDAIEELARREIDAERFDELMAAAS